MERTLEETQTTEQDTTAIGQTETSESEETTEVVSAEESLEALLPTLNEKQRTEYTTLVKKSQDFDGLAAKKRKLSTTTTPTAQASRVTVSEDAIRSVLYKDNERKALKDVINPKSPQFISELVEDANFQQIVSYLPRSLDRSSPEAIHKALKLATRMWKEERGETVVAQEKPEAALASTRGSGSGGTERPEVKRTERTFLRKQPGLDSWYKKE